MTKSLMLNRDVHISETTVNILINLPYFESNLSKNSLLTQTIRTAKSPEIVGKLFDRRSCHITIKYSTWVKFYDFLYSVKFTISRRTLGIFLGNALPSFIVVLANLLSIKVIYFSKSLKYFKKSVGNNTSKTSFTK